MLLALKTQVKPLKIGELVITGESYETTARALDLWEATSAMRAIHHQIPRDSRTQSRVRVPSGLHNSNLTTVFERINPAFYTYKTSRKFTHIQSIRANAPCCGDKCHRKTINERYSIDHPQRPSIIGLERRVVLSQGWTAGDYRSETGILANRRLVPSCYGVLQRETDHSGWRL